MAVISPEKGAKQIYRHHKHKWWWFQKIWSWIQWHLSFVGWPEESSARVAGDRSKVKSGWSRRVANGAGGKDFGWFHRWLALVKQRLVDYESTAKTGTSSIFCLIWRPRRWEIPLWIPSLEIRWWWVSTNQRNKNLFSFCLRRSHHTF